LKNVVVLRTFICGWVAWLLEGVEEEEDVTMEEENVEWWRCGAVLCWMLCYALLEVPFVGYLSDAERVCCMERKGME
jgi:hypothetical protein